MTPLLLLLACRKIEPAPAELDGLFHWYWQVYEPASDGDIQDSGPTALSLLDEQALAEKAEDGQVSDLSVEEAALVGVEDRDPALAVGLYVLTSFSCTWESLLPILVEPDQPSIYEGVYESYQRTFTSSREDFESGAVDTLTWTTVYQSKLLGSTFEAQTEGGVRRVLDGTTGRILLQRTHMPAPAVYDTDNKSFDQDYQIEVYLERPEGRMVHLYGIWRQADYGIGDLENESVQRILLNNLAAWDEETEKACGS